MDGVNFMSIKFSLRNFLLLLVPLALINFSNFYAEEPERFSGDLQEDVDQEAVSFQISLEILQQAKESLRDCKAKELVQSVLNDPKLLEDSNTKRKINDILRLVNLEIFSFDGSEKEFICSVLENPELLDKQDICKRIDSLWDEFVEKLEEEDKDFGEEKEGKSFFSSLHVFYDKHLEKRGTSLLALYTIYRKIMFVRALDTGMPKGWFQRVVNWAATGVYTGGAVLDTIGGMTKLQSYMDECLRTGNRQGIIECGRASEAIQGNFVHDIKTAYRIRDDDFAEKFNIKLAQKKRSKDRDLFLKKRFFSKKSREDFYSKKNADDKSGYEEHVYEPTCKTIREEGFAGSSLDLDFYSNFDAYLNRVIERKIDGLLKTVKVPSILRTGLLKNCGSRFLREVLLFKVVPTYAYWKGKQVFGRYDKRFIDYVPLKEAIKSAGGLARDDIINFIVKKLNGTKAIGDGRLQKTKDYSLGIIGPNLIKAFGDVVTPFLLISASEFVNDDSFLKTGDVGYQKDNYVAYVKREAAIYLGKSVVAYVALKLINKHKKGILGWLSKKIKRVMKFFVRRDWISQDTVENLQMLSGPLAKQMIPLLGMLFYERTLSRFDVAEMSFETYKTGDEFKFFDYLFANWLGSHAGNKFAIDLGC